MKNIKQVLMGIAFLSSLLPIFGDHDPYPFATEEEFQAAFDACCYTHRGGPPHGGITSEERAKSILAEIPSDCPW